MTIVKCSVCKKSKEAYDCDHCEECGRNVCYQCEFKDHPCVAQPKDGSVLKSDTKC
jgi:hypothetical protein